MMIFRSTRRIGDLARDAPPLRLSPGSSLPSAASGQNIQDHDPNHDDRRRDSDDSDGGGGDNHWSQVDSRLSPAQTLSSERDHPGATHDRTQLRSRVSAVVQVLYPTAKTARADRL